MIILSFKNTNKYMNHLKNPVTREHGMLKGKGFTKRYATNNSTASSTINDEKRCDEIHRFASLKLSVKTQKII